MEHWLYHDTSIKRIGGYRHYLLRYPQEIGKTGCP